MQRKSWIISLAFISWTVFIWVNRIRNVIADIDASTAEKIFSVTLSTIFLIFVVLIIKIIWRTKASKSKDVFVPLLSHEYQIYRMAILLTIVTWCIRIPMIAFAGHDLPFILVHAALGVISIAIAFWLAKSISTSSPQQADGK